ncbi:MAG: tetratricopeptide repeat protein, partial [Candidatus Aminicenantes bacterium]|nr:tetratricopeptide repeat protein [Candidatus Aminicenantes bacterium]
MCSKKILFLFVVLLVLSMGFGFQDSQDHKVLFEKAKFTMETKGDLQEAIKLFSEILEKYPNERKYAAQSQLYIGMCYERLGLEGALKAYQEVISNYGEQKEVVAKAKIRLSKLEQLFEKSKEPEGIRIKQVKKNPYLESLGTVSSDGQFLSYVDWGEGDVAIHNLINGENRLLTHEASSGETGKFAEAPAISKNGKKVAFSWWGPYNTTDLYIVDVENPSPRSLYRKEGEEMYPMAWLSDKELIIGKYTPKAGTAQVISFNISDRTSRVLKTFDMRAGIQLACSPDEKYLAYDFANENNNGNSDINIMVMDGGSEISLVKHPSNDRVLGWVPGRKEFLFISDRSGSWDLWAIPVVDGVPSGPSKRLY